MKDKKQIIIDGVNIRKCPYLYIDPKTGAIWCTERRFGGCQVMPNCRFKEVTRLKRERKIERIRNTRLSKKIAKELVKQDRYRKALEEIEKLAIKTNRDLCNNCGWVNTISCIPSEYICGDIKQILNIISGFADGRSKASPDSEQIEHTAAKPQM